MLVEIARYAAAALIVLGGVFGLVAAVGLVRFPDLYTRMHAGSKAGLVSAGLVLAAIAVVAMDGPVALRAVMGIGFLMLTTPVSAHLLAKIAYVAGVRPTHSTATAEMPKQEPDAT